MLTFKIKEQGILLIKNLCLIFLAMLFFPVTTAWAKKANGIKATGSLFRLTFEEVTLPGNEEMGLLSGTFLYEANEWLSLGPSAYGSLTGERGGFITIGLTGEVNKELNDYFSIIGGFFLGAGGGRGGYNLSGSGMMIRPHVGIGMTLGDLGSLRLGVSQIRFPDGAIDSTQAYVSYDYPFNMIIAPGWLKKNHTTPSNANSGSAPNREFSVNYRQYKIPSEVTTDSGGKQHDTIGLIGAKWNSYFDNHLFIEIESQGAMRGRSNGYMQIFMGAGYKVPLSTRTNLKISGDIGIGGGGGVDTGGGFLLDGELTLQQYLTDSIYIAASGGYIDAPYGSFEAISVSFQLGLGYGIPSTQKADYNFKTLSVYERRALRIRLAHQTYLGNGGDWRTHHNDLDVDNLGFQVDYFPTKFFYLSGQGLAAYGRGKAGAYMAGLVGMGVHYPIMRSPFFIEIEALAGAAGGGGLATGEGGVWQSNAGFGWNLSKTLSILLFGGHINALKSDFEATVVGVSLAYKFTLFAD